MYIEYYVAVMLLPGSDSGLEQIRLCLFCFFGNRPLYAVVFW